MSGVEQMLVSSLKMAQYISLVCVRSSGFRSIS